MTENSTLSRKKLVLFSLLPATLVLLACLSCGEIFLRLRYHTLESMTGVTDWRDVTFGNLTYYWDTYHPIYGWTNLPGYRSDARIPFKVTINNQGLRANRDYTLQRPANVNRIAVLGDSFVFGEDVDDDQTLPAYLERYLKGAEVLNFGVHGYGLGEMVLRLENEVFNYNPSHILLVITMPTDLGRITDTSFVHPKPAFTIEKGQLAVKNVPVPTASGQPFILKHSFVAAWLFGRSRTLVTDQTDENVLAVTQALVDRAKKFCSERGIPLMVVAITGPATAYEMDEDDAIREMVEVPDAMLRKMGIAMLDETGFLRLMLRKEPDVRTIISSTGTHWSGRGDCLLARNLAQELVHANHSWELSPAAWAAGCR